MDERNAKGLKISISALKWAGPILFAALASWYALKGNVSAQTEDVHELKSAVRASVAAFHEHEVKDASQFGKIQSALDFLVHDAKQHRH